ncbi:MAG: hypothetical protein KatS3mg065_0617 [Chloroflexota bacterium]|nr:MAG: hypothetical protein KatS3mg065_0617 [Chloroflexota bacterium]
MALTGPVDRALAEALDEIFLEVVVAPGFSPEALEVLGRRPNLRLLLDPGSARSAPRLGRRPRPASSGPPAGRSSSASRTSSPTTRPTWQIVSRRPPTEAERADLDLAWRLVRFVTSNAIVLVRDRMLVGLGVGQTSRVDAARQAVEKAVRLHGPEALRGAACASDAFFPFPDGVEVCLEAGVSAVVQPGGSVRDAEVVAAVDRAGATMCVTGRRHFRH